MPLLLPVGVGEVGEAGLSQHSLQTLETVWERSLRGPLSAPRGNAV